MADFTTQLVVPGRPTPNPVPFGKAALFAAAAILIGCVVLPTQTAFEAGLTVEGLVAGRAFWGCLTAALIAVAAGQARGLFHLPAGQGWILLLQSFGIGFMTLYAYAIALEHAHATPVILIVVGVSAVVGMLIDLPENVHVWFVPLSLLTTLAAALVFFQGVGGLGGTAAVFATLSGVIYGALPKLVRQSENQGAENVAQYLALATVIAVVWCVFTAGGDLAPTINAVTHPSSMLAGVVCTGLPYVLIQWALRPTAQGTTLPGSYATQLYGFEPVTVMLVAYLVMDEPMPMTAGLFAFVFIIQSALAGPLYSTINRN